MRYWIYGWTGAVVSIGLCAIALALAPDSLGPRLSGLQLGMTAAQADGAAGASIEKVSPAEWYIRSVTYKGAPADLWIFRDAAKDEIQAMRWRQDLIFAPAAAIAAPGLPALSSPTPPSDDGCTETLQRIAGVVRPFRYVSPNGDFETRFTDQLTRIGFDAASMRALLESGTAYAEGFEAAEPATFGCNFVFNAQRLLQGEGFEATAFADVRIDWSQAHERWRIYRMSLQIDLRLTR